MGTTALTYLVTPSLFVGAPPQVEATPVSTAQEAAEKIRSGDTVLLPDGAWGVVRETLELLGLDERTIEDRIHFARTARTLHAV